jgi:uncharacterized OB-fold protein
VTNETLSGTIQSHTVIRVPGKQHVGAGPFVLLLVELDDGRRVLGGFTGAQPPPIGSRVMGSAKENAAPLFRVAEG